MITEKGRKLIVAKWGNFSNLQAFIDSLSDEAMEDLKTKVLMHKENALPSADDEHQIETHSHSVWIPSEGISSFMNVSLSNSA